MPSVDINYAAVIAAAVINMVVGAAWYSPMLFGNIWGKLTGVKMETMKANGNKGMGVAVVGALLQAFVLAHFVQYANPDSTDFIDGAITGFWIWLGFVTFMIGNIIMFEGRSWKLWKLNSTYYLVVLLINGGLLLAWK